LWKIRGQGQVPGKIKDVLKLTQDAIEKKDQ
jgi:hypothetical protein